MKLPPQYITDRAGRNLVDPEPVEPPVTRRRGRPPGSKNTNIMRAAGDEVYRAPSQAIPSLDDIDSATLPEVPDRYTAAQPPVRPVPRLIDDNTVEVAELDTLTLLALEKAKEILSIPLDTADEDFTSVLRAQASQVATIFTAQLRADEGRFRKKQADNLGKLLTILATEERKLLKVLN